jgi:hypothetical protein
MADTVTSQTIQDGDKIAVLKFTNASDGTGESAVKKVDVSALSSNSLGQSCTSVSIARIYWACDCLLIALEMNTMIYFLVFLTMQVQVKLAILTLQLLVIQTEMHTL